MAEIRLVDLRKSFGATVALGGISVTVKDGELGFELQDFLNEVHGPGGMVQFCILWIHSDERGYLA